MPTGPRPKHVNVEGTERRHGPRTRRVGPADPAREIRVIVVLRQRPDGPPLPDVEHWARVEPGRRDFLTHEQIAERHGASADDAKLIEEHADAYGLRVVESNLARRSVELSGSIANMGEAFGIELWVFEGPSETYRSYEGPVKLPPALGDVILAVFGLDDRRMARRTGGGSGGPITPPLVAQLYGLPPIPASMAGETVGIFEFGGGYVVDSSGKPTDVDAYVEALGLTAPDVLAPVPILGGSNVVGGTPGNPGDDAEVALDLEVVASVAPGVKIAVYFIGTNSELGWAAVLGAVAVPGAGQPSPSVVTISWAWDEADWSSSQLNAMSGYFQTAAAHGVSSFAASGDKGSMGNSDETDGRSHVSYPACDPWVTSVGGTSIENVSGLEFDEITWNDNGVTGGGISTKFGLPSWQVGAGVPPSINDGTTVGRGVPDIAGYANGYEIEIYGQDGGSWWGTSESSPLYAATIAVLNAKLGFRLGYLNPTLYALATTVGADIFNDIDDDGSNAFTFTEQPPNPPTTITSPGYRATTGWDCCTGWGSIRLDRLYAALAKLPIVATAIAGGGWFGPVCVGSFVDQLLTIDNSGFGTLAISAITSSSPDFVVPDVTGYPLLVAPGDSIDLVVRFLPTGAGPRSAVITIASNDPFGTDRVDVSGTGDAPRLSVIVPDSGNLGRVCVGSFAQETVILSNSSRCPLTITAVHSSTGEFLAPTVFSLPLLVGPGGALPLPVRFAPTTLGVKTGTLTIESDDPAGPQTITLSGDAPAGSLTIAGSSVFGGVKCDTSAQRTVHLCNTGDCTVQLNQVELVQTHPAFRLINDPAPAAIHPGSQLEVVIEYRAIEKEPHPCRLVVHSSDPVRPEIMVDVIAHTLWDGCPGECDDRCRQRGCSCGGSGGCGGCGCGADRHRSHERHDCNHEEHVH